MICRASSVVARPALAKLTAAVLALAVYAPWAASAQLSQSDVLVYQAAFEAADLQAWATARAIERQASDPVLREVVDWVAMSNDAGDRSFAEIADFLGRHPDWPDQRGLRSQAERLMPAGLGRAEVLAYFEAQRQQDMQLLQSSYQRLADSDFQTIRSVQQLANYVQYQGGQLQ